MKTEADVRRFMTDKKWQRQAARERKAGLDFKGGEDALAIPKFLRREDGPALAPKPRQADIEELAPSPCRAKVEAAKAASKAAQQETKAKPHPDAPTEQELAIHKSVCKELVITGIGYEPMDEGGAPFMFDIWWPGTKRRITFYAAKAAPKAKRPRAGAGRRASRVKRRG